MVKELKFDLEFTENGVIALTEAGKTFLSLAYVRTTGGLTDVYRAAIAYNLHVRFDNAELRDKVAAISPLEP